MSDLTAADFGDLIAGRIRAEHLSISARWLERLRELLPVDVNEVFPTEELLDHIPALILEVAGYIHSPETEAVASITSITAKAQELGTLRHTQRASVHQLLSEYRLLGGILTHFVQAELQQMGMAPTASEAIEVSRRLNDAIWILTQTTVDTFVSKYTTTIASHAERLESFNRMVSHELRQPLGTLVYALPLLKIEAERGDLARCQHFLEVMQRNVAKLTQLMEQLEVLSRLQNRPPDSPDVQLVEVETIAREVARQLREMADLRGVEIQIAGPLPHVTIDVARLELILVNLISNAIRSSDPDKGDRFVRVEAVSDGPSETATILVQDNGIGIPAETLPTIFQRFVRAHVGRDTELGVRGSGLGCDRGGMCNRGRWLDPRRVDRRRRHHLLRDPAA